MKYPTKLFAMEIEANFVQFNKELNAPKFRKPGLNNI